MEMWHSLTIEETLEKLETNPETGLTQEEVKIRQEKFGRNQLPQEKLFSDLRIFLEQFRSPLIYILAIGGVVTLFFRALTDAAIIFAAVFLNTVVGFFQERKATKTLAELRKIIKLEAQVLRKGSFKLIDAQDLVPGDIIILNPGDKVSADARVIDGRDLSLNESILTGEWLPSRKNTDALPSQTPLAERKNLVFAGTVVEEGSGQAVVIETGRHTQLGKIAGLIKEIKEEKTPYQKKLARFSKIVAIFISLICAGVFLQGILAGKEFIEMFTVSLAVAIAAIPEGLPIAMTVVLALGMQRILKKQGLVKKLVSAETLGSTTVIITDKTGTLTEAKMAVAEIWPVLSRVEGPENFLLPLKIGLACSRAFLENPQDPEDQWIVRGEATEKALVLAAAKAGLDKKELEKKEPEIREALFSPLYKYSASLRQTPEGNIIYFLGAPEIIFEKSSDSSANAPEKRKKLEEMTSKGWRVLATAFRQISPEEVINLPLEAMAENLTFTGLIALKDPVRKEVKEAIKECEAGGIKVIFATGDHQLTAKAVAEELGFKIEGKNILSGEELEKLSETELEKIIDDIKIYYRMEPEQKLKIVSAWQKKGEVVAMTGDGVNDAPALKKADIGIVLGSGTEVAKETADLVLLNDSFAIITAAVKEGRAIIDNIRKIITYLLSDSFTEILLVTAAIIAKVPLPITGVQILWINLIEDGLPNLALAFEPQEKDALSQKPKGHQAPLLTPEMKTIIFIIGLFTNLILMAVFFWLLKQNYPLEYLRTMIFAILGISSLLYVFSCKSLRRNLWQINPFDNKMLIGAWFFGMAALLAALYFKPLNLLLGTVPLPLASWKIILGLGLLNVFLIELAKYYFIVKNKRD
ncbi:MAG: HAD-IC family P-type ATPase [bacterium]|nr:HAD-IC family P-type ATPase [bacterium]